MDEYTLFYFLSGFIIVSIFAINYFNQPGYTFVDEENRSGGKHEEMLAPVLPKYLTERFEYNFYRATYVVLAELLYVMLVLFLPDLVNQTNETAGNIIIPTRENIVLATLIITGIAPNLPLVRELLERSKKYLHRQAQIPKKGREIYRQLKNNIPKYSRSAISSILKDERYVPSADPEKAARMDLSPGDFELAPWTLEARWAKLTYLLYFLNQWSNRAPFKSYIGNTQLHYASIEENYRESQPLMFKHKAGDISPEESYRLNLKVDTTLNRTYRLISCLLYLASKSDPKVDSNLDELGYAAAEHNQFPIPWKTLVVSFAAVALSIGAGSTLSLALTYFGKTTLNIAVNPNDIVSWTGYTVPSLMAPVLLVLFAKRYLSTRGESWPVVTEFTRYKSIGDRPWHIYFVVALFAYLLGVFVLSCLVAGVKALSGNEIAWTSLLRISLAWSSVVFLTAGYIAFRLDSASNPNIDWKLRYLTRAAGAVSQGVLTASLIYFIYMYLKDLPLLGFSGQQENIGTLVVYCMIGLFLGVSINLASGVGQLRQRRNDGRRIASRPLQVYYEGKSAAARTVNVSSQGALIVSKTPLFDRAESIGQMERGLTVDAVDGTSARAKIVRVRGDRIHLYFENMRNWLSLQNALGIAAPGSA